MSQPVDPYRGGDPRRPAGPARPGPAPHQHPGQYPPRARPAGPLPGSPYGPPSHRQPAPDPRGHDPRGYGPGGYDPRGYDRPPPRSRPERAPDRYTEPGRWRRFLGPGLVLIVLAVVVQLLSLTVLPWGPSTSLPELWNTVTDQGIHGFSGWYVVLFGYPLAALSILLALAAVLESVAVKAIWGGLALVGLGVLVVRYGAGPLAGDRGFDFTTQEVTTATIALGAIVVVVFVLRMAVTTFRRVAGLILLAIGGVHVAAVSDLGAAGADQLSIGAYGPALGYLLTAVAAFLGPHRLMRL